MVLRVMAAIVLCVVVMCSAAPRALAQQQVQSPALVQTPSARSIGMGLTGTADDTDPMNTFLNPATLAALDAIYAAGFVGEVLGGVASDLNFAGFDFGLGYQYHHDQEWSLGAAAQLRAARLDLGETTVVDTSGQAVPDAQEDYTSFALSARLGIHAFAVGVGATFKRWGQDFTFQKTTGVWAYDFGLLLSHTVIVQERETTLSFGISALNRGNDFQVADSMQTLPTALNYGLTARISGPDREFLSTTVPELQVVFNVDFTDFENSPGAFRLGAEVALMQFAFGRVGWQKRESSGVHEIIFGLGAGLPLKHLVLRVDYAVAPVFRIKNEVDEPIDYHDHKLSVFAAIPL